MGRGGQAHGGVARGDTPAPGSHRRVDMLLEPEPGPALLGAPRAQGRRLRLGIPGVMQGTEAPCLMAALPHPVAGRR